MAHHLSQGYPMNKPQWLIVASVLLGISPSMLFAGGAAKKEDTETPTASRNGTDPSFNDAKVKSDMTSNVVPPCQVQLDLVVARVFDTELTQTHLASFRKWAELNTESHHPVSVPANCH